MEFVIWQEWTFKMTNITNPDQPMVMLDLETLSTQKNAVIVSISAVKFSLAEGITEKFKINVDPFSGKKLGLHIDPDTIAWWQKQDKAASDAWKINPETLQDALASFKKWYGTKSLPTWANSPSFQCMILQSSFSAIGQGTPWNFYDECCFRTVSKLFPDVEFEKTGLSRYKLSEQTNHLIKLLG